MSELLQINRVAFTIGENDIYWYGIIMCLSIVVALLVAITFSKAKKYDTEMPVNIALAVIPIGILSARLFAVLFDSGLELSDYFNFRTGGMSIIGAVIGGALGLTVYVLIKRPKDALLYFDTIAVVLILAQAIGRWGNFFNGEVYGQLIDESSYFANFPFAVEIDGSYYQALFFYESMLDLIGFAILSAIYLGGKKTGVTSAVYLIYYGCVRTILESFRQDEYILKLSGLPISKICSAVMIFIGVVLLIFVMIRSKKEKVKNGKKE